MTRIESRPPDPLLVEQFCVTRFESCRLAQCAGVVRRDFRIGSRPLDPLLGGKIWHDSDRVAQCNGEEGVCC